MITGVIIMKIMNIIGSSSSSNPLSEGSGKDTTIGANCEFTGNIKFTSTLVIGGTVKGNIESNDDTDAKVTIQNNGLVEGDVTSPTIVLKGEVNGNVHSSSKIVIDASALITGNVYYDILEMHGGATVNGSLIRNMGKTAGLLEKKKAKDNAEDSKNPGFLQSIDNSKEK